MASHFGPGSEDGGGFGVRRPLRFMAWKLELNEAQVEQLATILDSLKTERAQAAVDQRRSVGAFADALASDVFDVDGATIVLVDDVLFTGRTARAARADGLPRLSAGINATRYNAFTGNSDYEVRGTIVLRQSLSAGGRQRCAHR